MLDRLLVAIRSARPRMSLPAMSIVEAIVLSRGSIGSAARVARQLGLTNRFQLARLLEQDGLPPLHRLTEWVTILSWFELTEREHVSLCWIAFHSRKHPSACYRLVKKVTKHGWAEVRGNGATWLLRQFLKEVRTWKPASPKSSTATRRQLPPVAGQLGTGRSANPRLS